jgi:DNA polymerase-1
MKRKRTWLVVDVSNLCHRAFHTTRDLSHNGIRTGVVFGILRDILTLRTRFQVDQANLVFCFDSRVSKRQQFEPSYKKNRQFKYDTEPPDVKHARQDFFDQMTKLRKTYLRQIGCVNVFQQSGYEADDLIAKICYHSIPEKDDAIIVSSDKDLWQLLGDRVLQYNPITKKPMNASYFQEVYGVSVEQWAMVKAIAGCSSDNVIGVPGVGEKTAIKHLQGLLKPTSNQALMIRYCARLIARNYELVKLPYPGLAEIKLHKNQITKAKWDKLCKRLGISSLQFS